MTALCFDDTNGTICHLSVSDVRLPRAILAQRHQDQRPSFVVHGLSLNRDESELEASLETPLFFEWQRLEWLFEPG